MEYKEGPFLASDAKRLKRIKSLTEDVKAHHKFLTGKIWEQSNSPRFHIPTSKAVLYEFDINGTDCIKVNKFRWVTKNPRSSKSGGIRIIAAILFANGSPVKYVPILVYSAAEEDTDITYDFKNFKLIKSGVTNLIKYRLDLLDNPI